MLFKLFIEFIEFIEFKEFIELSLLNGDPEAHPQLSIIEYT
tara:strand:- start:41 stop:163 length:123 start_codon:yes stop_codon:yes gene_type:complete